MLQPLLSDQKYGRLLCVEGAGDPQEPDAPPVPPQPGKGKGKGKAGKKQSKKKGGKQSDPKKPVSSQKSVPPGHRSMPKVRGTLPKDYPEQELYGSRANEIYSLANQAELSKLMEYLFLNGSYELVPVQKRGSCLFASIRRGTQVPAEYTNTHLRRQLVAFAVENRAFLFDRVEAHIQGNYGHTRLSKEEYLAKKAAKTLTRQEKLEYHIPGPFSYASYLQYISTPGNWGDEIVITMLSMMWQIGITILHAESLLQTRVRHTWELPNTDMVLVFCGRNHYVAAGEYRAEIRGDSIVLRRDRCI